MTKYKERFIREQLQRCENNGMDGVIYFYDDAVALLHIWGQKPIIYRNTSDAVSYCVKKNIDVEMRLL